MTSRIPLIRRLFQIAIVVAVLVTGFRYAMGWSRTSIETYCPFGVLETALSLFTHKQFACATGERNLALFVGLILLTVLSRRVFCSWICPVGSISEWIALFVSRLRGSRVLPRKALLSFARRHPRLDVWLRWLRLPVLATILYLTFRTGELLFRGVDPYYILFSFHGHDVQYWSYIVLGVVLTGVILIPMAWCRYLCPLGAALWPFSAVGGLRVVRDATACTDCGRCDRVCLQNLTVSKADSVRSGECTLCGDCLAECPQPGALSLTAFSSGFRPGTMVVPILIVLITVGALYGATVFAIPSVVVEYPPGPHPSAHVQTVVMIVDGVRCVDTAATAAMGLNDTPGVMRCEAFASHSRLEVTFDPQVTTPEALRESIEGPIYDTETGNFLFNQFKVARIDNK